MNESQSTLLLRWADEAHKAFQNGYYLQSIIIDLNLINHFLRDSIHSHAHKLTMELTGGSAKRHPYLEDLIFNTRNKLTGGTSDRSLYKEAVRLKLIPENFYKELDMLYKRRNLVLHRLFSEEYAKRESDNAELLKQLATDYRGACLKCVQLATELMMKMETKKVEIKAEKKEKTEQQKKRRRGRRGGRGRGGKIKPVIEA